MRLQSLTSNFFAWTARRRCAPPPTTQQEDTEPATITRAFYTCTQSSAPLTRQQGTGENDRAVVVASDGILDVLTPSEVARVVAMRRGDPQGAAELVRKPFKCLCQRTESTSLSAAVALCQKCDKLLLGQNVVLKLPCTQFFSSRPDPQVVQEALGKGSKDNCTAIVVFFSPKSGDGMAAPPPLRRRGP